MLASVCVCFRVCVTLFFASFMQFWLFQPYMANFIMLGIKRHFLQLRNSMVILSYTFTRSLTHFWSNFNMFGIKKYVLKLRNSLVVLVEAVGLS